MLPEDEYAGIAETLHLLRSPANAERLLRSIRSVQAGQLTEREILDGHTMAHDEALDRGP
jgi:antitoxin YefM